MLFALWIIIFSVSFFFLHGDFSASGASTSGKNLKWKHNCLHTNHLNFEMICQRSWNIWCRKAKSTFRIWPTDLLPATWRRSVHTTLHIPIVNTALFTTGKQYSGSLKCLLEGDCTYFHNHSWRKLAPSIIRKSPFSIPWDSLKKKKDT